MKGTCQCGAAVLMIAIDGRWQFSNHACTRRPLTTKGAETPSSGDEGSPSGRLTQAFSNAKPTDCAGGHRHASKLEARTCERLTLEAKATGWTLLQQVAFELPTIAPKRPGLRHKIRVDFLLVPPGWRAIESKGRESRDFPLRAAAFTTSYGKPLEIVK